MATAFLAVNTKTDAQVIYTDVDPDAVIVNDDMDIDFDGDGVADVNFSHLGFSSSGSTANFDFVNVQAGNAVIGSLSGAYMYPLVLASGAAIAPSATNFQTASLGSLFYGSSANNFGNWNGQTGFLGCRFVAGDGETHYGWIQLAVATSGASLTIIDYGYESTPDMAINAGDGIVAGIADIGVRKFNVDITPNPTIDQAVITFPSAGSDMRMSVLNSVGQELFAEEIGNAASYTLDLKNYAAGVYFVRLQDGKRVAFSKVTKQ